MEEIKITIDDWLFLKRLILARLEVRAKKYDGVIIPLRGGFYLGDYISRKLDLPCYYIKVNSYNNRKQGNVTFDYTPIIEKGKYLICDDIYDTGKTIEAIKTFYSDSEFDVAVLVSKQDKSEIIVPYYVSQDTWVEFFWEVD